MCGCGEDLPKSPHTGIWGHVNQLLSRYDRFAISIQQQGRIIVQVTMMGLVETAPLHIVPELGGFYLC